MLGPPPPPLPLPPPYLLQLLVQVARLLGQLDVAQPHPRAGLVDQIDGLVGQEAVRDVLGGELGGGHEGLVGVAQLVVALVPLTQTWGGREGLSYRSCRPGGEGKAPGCSKTAVTHPQHHLCGLRLCHPPFPRCSHTTHTPSPPPLSAATPLARPPPSTRCSHTAYAPYSSPSPLCSHTTHTPFFPPPPRPATPPTREDLVGLVDRGLRNHDRLEAAVGGEETGAGAHTCVE